MTHDPARIAEVAKGLSEAMREGLERAFDNKRGRMAVAYSTGSSGSLMRYGLAIVEPGEFWPSLTPLGLAVRQHLLERNTDV